MRTHLTRLTAVLAATGLLGATGAVALAAGTHTTTAERAHLTLVQRSPITLRGLDFPARTRVTVKLNISGTRAQQATTSSTGTFTVVFRSNLASCSEWTATATRHGAAAVVLHGPKPLCAPAGGY